MCEYRIFYFAVGKIKNAKPLFRFILRFSDEDMREVEFWQHESANTLSQLGENGIIVLISPKALAHAPKLLRRIEALYATVGADQDDGSLLGSITRRIH